MKRLAAKLAFVHRVLWQRDAAYRWAVLIGPPPLLGCALAALLWAGAQQRRPDSLATPAANAAWAHWKHPIAEFDHPIELAPTGKLPPLDASGRPRGLQLGWDVGIHTMLVDAAMDPNVTAPILTSFNLDQTSIPLDRILEAEPPDGLFVGAARTLLVVRTAGLYALSLRLNRSSPKSANCMVRLSTTKQPLIRSLALNTNLAVLNYRATEFRLTPGLYGLAALAACWRGDAMVGAGELALMVRHPGELAPQPARDGEVMRPISRPGG